MARGRSGQCRHLGATVDQKRRGVDLWCSAAGPKVAAKRPGNRPGPPQVFHAPNQVLALEHPERRVKEIGGDHCRLWLAWESLRSLGARHLAPEVQCAGTPPGDRGWSLTAQFKLTELTLN